MFVKKFIMSNDCPHNDDFLRINHNNLDLKDLKNWELVSASTKMKDEYKYGASKFEMVQSYLHAASILSDNLCINDIKLISLRSICIPFLYLCRHTAELAVKNALEITNIKINTPSHKIKKMWKLFIEKNQLYINDNETAFIDRISTFVDILDTIDDDGIHLRYATSNNNELYRKTPLLINPNTFITELSNMVVTLSCIDIRLFED